MAVINKRLKVLFLTAEADPYIKVGGLGDVAGSLPSALRSLSNLEDNSGTLNKHGLDIRLVIPYHGALKQERLPVKSIRKFSVPYKGGAIISEGLAINNAGYDDYFIAGDLIPADIPVYSGDDQADGKKYVYFSVAALQFMLELNWVPDIIHANDWHTALSVYVLTLDKWKTGSLSKASSLIGVHNLPYYGPHLAEIMGDFGITPAVESDLPVWAQDIPLPLGLLSAERIVTVSPSYAKEIQTPKYGAGLDEFLRNRSSVISGILNGLDTDLWNPERDPNLCKKYSIKNLEERISNKKALQAEIGLEQNARVPLIGMVSRLDHQKGIDIVPDAFRQINNLPAFGNQEWQLVLLGTGDPELESQIRQLEREFPDRVKASLTFDPALSHRIYSGADMLVIPSRYEPCGLTQLIAMRYGCIPIGRATGGLKDTIQDYYIKEDSTGFLFKDGNPETLANTIATVFPVYEDKKNWKGLMKRAMSRDFSWARSARSYMQLYFDLRKRKVY